MANSLPDLFCSVSNEHQGCLQAKAGRRIYNHPNYAKFCKIRMMLKVSWPVGSWLIYDLSYRINKLKFVFFMFTYVTCKLTWSDFELSQCSQKKQALLKTYLHYLHLLSLSLNILSMGNTPFFFSHRLKVSPSKQNFVQDFLPEMERVQLVCWQDDAAQQSIQKNWIDFSPIHHSTVLLWSLHVRPYTLKLVLGAESFIFKI